MNRRQPVSPATGRLSSKPFGLTNASATFLGLNQVFHDYLDKFVVVYLDDIVVYSSTLEEHMEHLKLVFGKLRENQLYVKKEKRSFAQEKTLGHIIERGHIRMDLEKVRAIREFLPPSPNLALGMGLSFLLDGLELERGQHLL